MSLLRLVRRNALRHPVRTALTFGFAALALFVFVFLRSAVTTLEAATKAAATNRLVVQSSVSLYVYMPYSYRNRIAQVDGVESVNPFNWFGTYYKDRSDQIAQFATDLPLLLEQFPELEMPKEEAEKLLATRKGVMVGREIAAKYGWKPGMKLPLFSKIYPLEGGSAWDFEVCAVYVSRRPTLDESTIFFHWEYLDEVRKRLRASGYDVGEQDVAIFWVRVKDGHEPQAVLEAVDALYASGPQRVRTLTESMFQAQFASMLGNVPTLLLWIGGAVVFAIFFSVLNTTQMAARERSRDVGILKALGFPDALAGRLLLLESMFVVGSGGLLGVLLGGLSEGMFRGLFGLLIPNYYVEARTLALGVLLALAIGIVGGILPSIRLARLRTVDVLREEG